MKTRNFQLDTVKEVFPEHAELIATLYHCNDLFRTLCEEYYACVYYLNKFEKEFSERKESVEEFENVRHELEKELRNYIGSHKK